MAGPALPTNLDTTYADDGADASVKLHQQVHDTAHGILNKLDTAIGTATTGDVLTWNGTVYAPAAATGGGGGFASTFIDIEGAVSQNVPASAFTTINLDTVNSDTGSNFNATNSIVNGIDPHCYKVPTTGIYLCLAKTRVGDGSSAMQLGVGVHTSSVDDASFQWQTTGTALRSVLSYQRLAQFSAGAMLRLYVYAGSQFYQTVGSLTIIRIA